jgi:hypothetical protein
MKSIDICIGLSPHYDNEYFFDFMPIIFLESLLKIKKDLKINIHLFLDPFIISKLLKYLLPYKKCFNNLNIIKTHFEFNNYDIRYEIIKLGIEKIPNNFWYFDVDVLFLKPFDNLNISNSPFLVEKVPNNILKMEEKIIGKQSNLFYNWYNYIDNNTRIIYKDFFSSAVITNTIKNLDIQFSKYLNDKLIPINDQQFGFYYPKHKLKDFMDKYFFHYDGLIDSGTFYLLNDYYPELYNHLIKVLNKIPEFKGIKNDRAFYEKI